MVAGLATLRELDEPGPRRALAPASASSCSSGRGRSSSASEVVKDVRGLGLMWAIEFEEPDGRLTTWRCSSGCSRGSFAQLVVVPLFRDHRILSQVAGHGLNVVKALPPLVVTEDDLDWFVDALDETSSARRRRWPRALMRFALGAARAGRTPRAGALTRVARPLSRRSAKHARAQLLGGLDQPPAEDRRARARRRAACSGETSIRTWFSDASAVPADLVALLGHDRDLAHLGQERLGELVDLGGSGLAPREDRRS